MEWSTDEDVNGEVLEAANGGMRHAHFTCGIEFQREHVEKLGSLHDRLKRLREDFISKADEPRANAAFRAQMIVSGSKHFLEMWVRLKEDDPVKAWDSLVEAQKKFELAQRILFDPVTDDFLLHLLAVERTVPSLTLRARTNSTTFPCRTRYNNLQFVPLLARRFSEIVSCNGGRKSPTLPTNPRADNLAPWRPAPVSAQRSQRNRGRNSARRPN
ncbi:MAG: hypothetical protein ACRELG_26690, partial [Gemmataceae bacterium]